MKAIVIVVLGFVFVLLQGAEIARAAENVRVAYPTLNTSVNCQIMAQK